MVGSDDAGAQRSLDRVQLVAVMIGGRRKRVGQVLIHHPARMKRHHLHAEADAEYRKVRKLFEGVEKRHFVGLAILMNRSRLRMGRDAEGFHDRIVAAGEQKSVDAREPLRRRCASDGRRAPTITPFTGSAARRGEQHRDPSRRADHRFVVAA